MIRVHYLGCISRFRMKYLALLFTLVFKSGLIAQSSPIWSVTYPDVAPKAIVVRESLQLVAVCGVLLDTCNESMISLVTMDSSGANLLDTAYEWRMCFSEDPMYFIESPFDPGYLLFAQHEVSTAWDSSYVHFVNPSRQVQSSSYIGEYISAIPVIYQNKLYVSKGNITQDMFVMTINASGIVDTLNALLPPPPSSGANRVVVTNGNVMEYCAIPSTDTSFVCYVHDTSGSIVTTFVADGNPAQNEYHWFSGASSNGVMTVISSTTTAYVRFTNPVGNLLWSDTIAHGAHQNQKAFAVDSTNNVGYILCAGSVYAKYLYSYNLLTGQCLDSVTIDSVVGAHAGLKTGPAGGVYLFYVKNITSEHVVEQYDSQLNMLWTGTIAHPSCSMPCLMAPDYYVDSLGYIYTISYCSNCPGAEALVNKFGPSLVGLQNTSSSANTVTLSPNPANQFVVIGGLDRNTVLMLFDCTGRLIFEDIIFSDEYILDVSGYAKGIYFIRGSNSNGSVETKKLVIEK